VKQKKGGDNPTRGRMAGKMHKDFWVWRALYRGRDGLVHDSKNSREGRKREIERRTAKRWGALRRGSRSGKS